MTTKPKKCGEPMQGPLGTYVGGCTRIKGHDGPHKIRGRSERDMVETLTSRRRLVRTRTMQSTHKFLPGPWFVSRDPRPDMELNNHIASVERPHLEVCSMFHTKDQDDNEQGEANARLVAAAPDLLEALECLLPGLVLDLRYADEDDDREALQSRVTTVTDAIAKAVGS